MYVSSMQGWCHRRIAVFDNGGSKEKENQHLYHSALCYVRASNELPEDDEMKYCKLLRPIDPEFLTLTSHLSNRVLDDWLELRFPERGSFGVLTSIARKVAPRDTKDEDDLGGIYAADEWQRRCLPELLVV